MFGKNNNSLTEESILQALSTVQEPELENDLVSLNMIKEVTINGSEVGFTIQVATPNSPLHDQLVQASTEAVQRVSGVNSVNVQVNAEVQADSRIAGKLNLPIKNIIAVASGKGGVGKTTFSTNLAVSLVLEGLNVGVLDADIYGPNIPMMFGVSGKPQVDNGKMIPFESHGVQLISMGFLMPDGEAVVWRGPMLHKAIQQLFVDVRWGELDFLIVDLPPGTGDAQLSMAQSTPLTGSVIITGPQAVAVADARRGAAAFQRLEVPILGLIENMSGEIFGTGGGEAAAQVMGVDYLGTIPLDPRVRVGGDTGAPIVAVAPESAAAVAIRLLARKIAGRVNAMAVAPEPALKII